MVASHALGLDAWWKRPSVTSRKWPSGVHLAPVMFLAYVVFKLRGRWGNSEAFRSSPTSLRPYGSLINHQKPPLIRGFTPLRGGFPSSGTMEPK